MKILLVALAATLALAACSGSSGDDATDTPASTATSGSSAPTATEATVDATATTPAKPTATRQAAQPTPTDVVIDVRTPGATDPSPTAVPSGGNDDLIQSQLANVLSDTSDLRGLSVEQDIPSEVISRDQLHENLVAMLEKDYPREEADADSLEMWLLGLVPDRGLDMYQLQLDLLSEQIIGYYDPDANELFIISDNSSDGLSAEAEYTAAHEYTHALQDQHYDLEKVRAYEGKDADRDLGATALVEGDASLAGTLYLFQYMDPSKAGELFAGEIGSTSVIDSAPPYIADTLVFPYQQGADFVSQLYLSGGFDAVDDALADPPSSTEQILHPEKYTGPRDEPVDVTLPDLAAALGSGWSQTDSDTLGEWDFRELLSLNGATDPEGGADGWGGARFALLQNGDQAVVALSTIWDSDDEAGEFYDALLETLPAGAGAGSVVQDGERYIGVSRTGAGVVFVSGTDSNAVSAALSALGAAV